MDPTADEYEFELTIGEAAIHSIVKQMAAAKQPTEIVSMVEDMLNDERVAEPTQQQMEREDATEKMTDGFSSRLNRAHDRLTNGPMPGFGADTGVEVEFIDTSTYEDANDGVMTIEELGGVNATVKAIVTKVEYDGSEPKTQSTYPLIQTGEHVVCTCQDRHYNRQQGGTCYHELAYDIRFSERKYQGENMDSDDITIRI